MANSEKRYGKARLRGGIRFERVFKEELDAIAWYDSIVLGWRRIFVTDAMIYEDAEHRRPMLEGFDMLHFRCDVEDYGLHHAYDWAQEGKYGSEGMPEIIKRPKRCIEN